jgi:hypothetical protein
MFCYKCGASNKDNVKFCRACGASLEGVSQALSDKSGTSKGDRKNNERNPMTTEDWLAKRGKGISNIVTGTIYAGGSLLAPLAVYLFLHDKFWAIILLFCVGWIFFSGLSSLAKGIGAVLESNTVLRGLNAAMRDSSTASLSALPAAGYEPGAPAGDPGPSALAAPASVTESTTRLLDEPTDR